MKFTNLYIIYNKILELAIFLLKFNKNLKFVNLIFKCRATQIIDIRQLYVNTIRWANNAR
jgi:hypothetical protein